MAKNMILIMECPDCIQENEFSTEIPKNGDTFCCPTCGRTFVVKAEWLDELNGIVAGLYDSIDRFVEFQN
jgi:NMD protein affecting ribosome stability and mRNA decay